MLRPDDGVVEAFNAYIEALRQLHDLIEETNNWLQTHDALLEPSTGTVYTSAEALIAALNQD